MTTLPVDWLMLLIDKFVVSNAVINKPRFLCLSIPVINKTICVSGLALHNIFMTGHFKT